MKARWFVWGSGVLVLAAAVACATNDDSAGAGPTEGPDGAVSPSEGGATQPPDAGSGDDGGELTDAAALCSDAGWCVTALPDVDLQLLDIWPFEHNAFAVATSDVKGLKLLEWQEATNAWSYIDDGTQNGLASYAIAYRVWAPNADEVYFGMAPGYIYHGTRPTPPATAWTWTYHSLDSGNFAGVWGASETDVYAWADNFVYHRVARGDAGADAGDAGATAPGDDPKFQWIKEYAAPENTTFAAAAGSGPNDIWFFGNENPCTLALRKSGNAYHAISDSVSTYNAMTGDTDCVPKAGTVVLPEGIGAAQGFDGGGLIAVSGITAYVDPNVVEITPKDGGAGYAVALSDPNAVVGKDNPFLMPPYNAFTSVWGLSAGDFYITGTARLLHGGSVWNDAGTYTFSTVVLNGAPVFGTINQVRGTSANNRWAVGVHYALHNTNAP